MLYGVESLSIINMRPIEDNKSAQYMAKIEFNLKSYSVPADNRKVILDIPFVIKEDLFKKDVEISIDDIETELKIESYSLKSKAKELILNNLEKQVFSLLA